MTTPTQSPLMTSTNMTSESEEPTEGQKIAVVCILSVLSVFGTIGNGLVLYVFSSKGNKVTSTIFILALAWADIFTCSIIIPLTIAFTATDGDLGYDWLCKLYQFLITFNVPLAAFIMVAIAVDRYFSICHPFLHAVTPRRARVTVFFLCMFAFLLGTITALAYGYGEVMGPVATGAGEMGNNSTIFNASAGALSALDRIDPSISSSAAADGGGGSRVMTTTIALDPFQNNSTVSADFVAGVVESSGWVHRQCLPTERIISFEFLMYYQKCYASFYLLSLLAVLIIYAFIYRSVVRRREWRRRQRSSRPIIKSPVTIATDVEEFELRTKNGTANTTTTTTTNTNTPGVTDPLNDDNGNNNANEHGGDHDDEEEDIHQGNNNGGDSSRGAGGGKPRRKKKTHRSSSSGGRESTCSETRSLKTSSQKKAHKERRDFNFLANIRTAGMLFVVSIVFIVSFLPAWLMAVQVLAYHIVVFYLYFVYNVANPVIYAFMNHAFRKELKRMLRRGMNYCHD